ncbi:MAG: helix-turn-helix domain-containing protein [Lachnospiraceae bacterium]|nr:helix-turn-helix domain-containing protein [Lachnospiraceae bacterium]
MNKLEILSNALEYIEQNLAGTIKTEDVANNCFCSKSTLENLFRCINHISVHDYITKRRMTCAGRMLLETPDKRVLDVAIEYGFSSNEAFTRAFSQVWNCTPSEFRRSYRYTELFPRYLGYESANYKDGTSARYKNVDAGRLYDLFKERKNCYFVCSDIVKLTEINKISHKAGDLAILEAFKRFNSEASEKDFVFRIGGDEFAILTDSEDGAYALELSERIKAHNGETYEYDGEKMPLLLFTCVMKLNKESDKYKDFFEELHRTLKKERITIYNSHKDSEKHTSD